LEAENARMRHTYPLCGYVPVVRRKREAGISVPPCLLQKPIPEGDMNYRLQVSAALYSPVEGKAISAAAGRIRTPSLFLAGMNNGVRKQAGLLASGEPSGPSQGPVRPQWRLPEDVAGQTSQNPSGIRLQWRDRSGFAPRFPIKLQLSMKAQSTCFHYILLSLVKNNPIYCVCKPFFKNPLPARLPPAYSQLIHN
jgi:hypothetical protein